MEQLKLPEYFKRIKFKTIFGTEHSGFLNPTEGMSPIYVETNNNPNKKALFFKVNQVIYWEYI